MNPPHPVESETFGCVYSNCGCGPCFIHGQIVTGSWWSPGEYPRASSRTDSSLGVWCTTGCRTRAYDRMCHPLNAAIPGFVFSLCLTASIAGGRWWRHMFSERLAQVAMDCRGDKKVSREPSRLSITVSLLATWTCLSTGSKSVYIPRGSSLFCLCCERPGVLG